MQKGDVVAISNATRLCTRMQDVTYEEVPCNPNKGEMLRGTMVTRGLEARCIKANTCASHWAGARCSQGWGKIGGLSMARPLALW
eukprot:3928724-Amphidinium_carterae.1